MGKTKIEWCDRTWSPVTGCTPISEGCANCYAARMAKRLAGRYGYPKDEPFKPATIHGEKFIEPYGWKQPQKIFVCSMGDLFHEDVTFNLASRVWDVIFDCGAVENVGPQHIFMILTKRPDKLLRFCNWMKNDQNRETAYHNLWLGVTAENQRTADERIPILLHIPAAKRFVSVEPMLGPVDLKPWLYIAWQCSSCLNYFPDPWQKVCPICGKEDYWSGSHKYNPPHGQIGSGLSWVIAGPETGPRTRPYDPRWIANLYDQCRVARVPFFDKKDMLGNGIQEWPR